MGNGRIRLAQPSTAHPHPVESLDFDLEFWRKILKHYLHEVAIYFCHTGKEFNYTTHGFTLLSAVIEAVSGETFENRMKRTFNQLGMDNTFLDENEPIIPNRAR